MTAGNNDDPFAYLYRPEGGEADADGDAAPGRTTAQPGVPRTSYNQVQRVGERRQAVPPQQPGGYGRPPQQPYGRRQGPQPPATQAMPQTGGGHGGGPQGGPNSRGLLIGAVAVVAAVAIGIGVAIANGDSGTHTAGGGASTTPTATGGGSGQSAAPRASATGDALPGVTDASTLTLSGGATVASDISGAQAAGGRYVTGMSTVGASASWTFDVPSGGRYTLFVTYSVPGSDSDSTLTVNGENQSRPLRMKNYAGAPSGNWKKGWTRTYGYISLKGGRNTVAVSCQSGNTCDFYLDQVWLKQGQVTG